MLLDKTKTFWGHEIENVDARVMSCCLDFIPIIVEIQAVVQRIVNITNRVNDNDMREVYGACLFIRATNTFESILVLLERGLLAEAKSLLRVLFEALLTLRRIESEPEIVHEYMEQGEVSYLKNMKAKKELLGDNPEEHKLFGLDDDYDKKLREVKRRGKSAESCSEQAGLKSDYVWVYRALCDEIHVSSNSIVYHLPELDLEDFLLEAEQTSLFSSENGFSELAAYQNRPISSRHDIRWTLVHAIDYYCLCIRSFAKIFGHTIEELDSIIAKREALIELEKFAELEKFPSQQEVYNRTTGKVE